jgi:uncharacterized protein DUF4124
MKTKSFIAILIIPLWFFILLVQPVDAKIYKWKDENGKTHFTDSPEKIPFKYRKNIKKKKAADRKRTISCNRPIPQTMKDELLNLDNVIYHDNKKLDKMLGGSSQKNIDEFFKKSLKTAKLAGDLKRKRRLHQKILLKYECFIGN